MVSVLRICWLFLIFKILIYREICRITRIRTNVYSVKYCYINLRYLPPFFEHKHRIVYSIVENVLSVDEIQHPVVRCVLGEYGIEDIYMCVPARLGRAGVLEVVDLPLNAEELAALQASAATIAEAVDSLGLRG